MRKNRDKRYRVSLSVRYATAAEFVREYAENLSKGGLYITGGENLSPRQQVTVEIDLPGFRSFTLRAEVAHVMDRATASRFGRRPGAGLEICDAPDKFWSALSDYLQRLGRRTEYGVICGDSELYPLLDDAGYQVQRAPAPGKLRSVLRAAPYPVLAIAVPKHLVSIYASVVKRDQLGHLIVGTAGADQIGEILTRLDAQLDVRIG